MKITRDDLIIWIDRSPSNSDLDLCNYIIGLQKSRLKAIEYVNNHIYQETFTGYMDSYELKNLLEMLGGKE